MAMHPTNSKRTRAYNIFVGAFFATVLLAMMASGVIAEGQWTTKSMLAKIAPFAVTLLFGIIGATAYYRGKR